MNPAAGSKRPAPDGSSGWPRKRPSAEDDDFVVDEDFDLEPPDDDGDMSPDLEVNRGLGGRRCSPCRHALPCVAGHCALVDCSHQQGEAIV